MSASPRSPQGNPGRQRVVLQIAVAILILSGLLIFMVPVPLPKPIRIGIFAVDMIAALALWVLGKQKLPR